jgi:coproporphyrinogen III oxidase-like Fe-S oxidoreductase
MRVQCPISRSAANAVREPARPRPPSARLEGIGVSGKVAEAHAGLPKDRSDTMIERLERALVLAAYIVLRHGPIYAPYIDRLERELEAARQNDPTERAKRILATYAVHGTPNAMRLENSRGLSKSYATMQRKRAVSVANSALTSFEARQSQAIETRCD